MVLTRSRQEPGVYRQSHRTLANHHLLRHHHPYYPWLSQAVGVAPRPNYAGIVNGLTSRSLLGRIANLPNRYQFKKWSDYVLPIVRERMGHIRRKMEDPDYKFEDPASPPLAIVRKPSLTSTPEGFSSMADPALSGAA